MFIYNTPLKSYRLLIFFLLVFFSNITSKTTESTCQKTNSLVEINKIIPSVQLDIRYATKNNFTGKVVYPSAKCYLQKEAVVALKKVQDELALQKDKKHPMGLGLKIFDGYRPLSIQKIFWQICPNENFVANPTKGSKHNRGTAVDLTLIDIKTGKELLMPSEYDDFSDKAFRNYEKMPNDEIRKNCKILETVMSKQGFKPLPSEWWHFDFKNWERHPILDVQLNDIDN